MNTAYFLIRSTEDGVRIDQLTQQELLNRINPDENGYTYYGGTGLNFLTETPKDFNYVGEKSVLIIKGEIVVPRPVERIVSLEID